MRDIEKIISGVPGLDKMMDQLSESLTVCECVISTRGISADDFPDVYGIIQPYIMVTSLPFFFSLRSRLKPLLAIPQGDIGRAHEAEQSGH